MSPINPQPPGCLGAGGQLGPGKYLLAAPHLVNLVPAGQVDSELKQHNLLGQDGYPNQEQDDGGALVAQWKHGEPGDWQEKLRQ